jgi:hypothetical protein
MKTNLTLVILIFFGFKGKTKVCIVLRFGGRSFLRQILALEKVGACNPSRRKDDLRSVTANLPLLTFCKETKETKISQIKRTQENWLGTFQTHSLKVPRQMFLACLIWIEKAASTFCDPRAAVARFTTVSCLHLNGGAIPGYIHMYDSKGYSCWLAPPTPAKISWLFGSTTI